MQRWLRRIRDLADTAVAILSRDARRLDPELDLDTLLRPFTDQKPKLLDAAVAAFWLACQRPNPGQVFPAGKPLPDPLTRVPRRPWRAPMCCGPR